MTEEKNIDASKQTDKSQEQFADERLSDDELENVAGGVGLIGINLEYIANAKTGGK